jgi:hypothetical protein
MRKFYIGQPVVCINDNFSWAKRVFSTFPIAYPSLGQRYVVRAYLYIGDDKPIIALAGITNIKIPYTDGVWREAGFWDGRFAPVTEQQVKEIISQAIKPPSKSKHRKKEDV